MFWLFDVDHPIAFAIGELDGLVDAGELANLFDFLIKLRVANGGDIVSELFGEDRLCLFS